MKILVKNVIRFFSLCTAFVGVIPPALAQTVILYPTSTIIFSSHSEGANTSGCPSGGETNAFLQVVIANGWTFQSSMTKESKAGVGSPLETNSYEHSFITVHPDSKRLRYWLVRVERRIDRQPNVTSTSCTTMATLQGDRLDDSLPIDIGVLLGDKLKKGEQVAPIAVSSPFYCGKDWAARKKDSLGFEYKVFDCNTIGIPAPAYNVPIFQTENLPK